MALILEPSIIDCDLNHIATAMQVTSANRRAHRLAHDSTIM